MNEMSGMSLSYLIIFDDVQHLKLIKQVFIGPLLYIARFNQHMYLHALVCFIEYF